MTLVKGQLLNVSQASTIKYNYKLIYQVVFALNDLSQWNM